MEAINPLSKEELSFLPKGWAKQVAATIAPSMKNGRCGEVWARCLAKAQVIDTKEKAMAIGIARSLIAKNKEEIAKAGKEAAAAA